MHLLCWLSRCLAICFLKASKAHQPRQLQRATQRWEIAEPRLRGDAQAPGPAAPRPLRPTGWGFHEAFPDLAGKETAGGNCSLL